MTDRNRRHAQSSLAPALLRIGFPLTPQALSLLASSPSVPRMEYSPPPFFKRGPSLLARFALLLAACP